MTGDPHLATNDTNRSHFKSWHTSSLLIEIKDAAERDKVVEIKLKTEESSTHKDEQQAGTGVKLKGNLCS